MNNRDTVICPGCGRGMGVAKPIFLESIGKFEARLFCPCGWMAPFATGATEESAIDEAFARARIRREQVYNPHLGDE